MADSNSVQELQPQKSLPARFELEPAMVQLSIMADVYMAAGWNLWAGDSAVPALFLECSVMHFTRVQLAVRVLVPLNQSVARQCPVVVRAQHAEWEVESDMSKRCTNTICTLKEFRSTSVAEAAVRLKVARCFFCQGCCVFVMFLALPSHAQLH